MPRVSAKTAGAVSGAATPETENPGGPSAARAAPGAPSIRPYDARACPSILLDLRPSVTARALHAYDAAVVVQHDVVRREDVGRVGDAMDLDGLERDVPRAVRSLEGGHA